MTDREDATVDGMEPAALQAMADRPPAHAHPLELPAGDHPVLARGERSDRPVYVARVTFGPHMGPKCSHVGCRPRDRLMCVTFGPHTGPKCIRVSHGRIVPKEPPTNSPRALRLCGASVTAFVPGVPGGIRCAAGAQSHHVDRPSPPA